MRTPNPVRLTPQGVLASIKTRQDKTRLGYIRVFPEIKINVICQVRIRICGLSLKIDMRKTCKKIMDSFCVEFDGTRLK